MRTIDFKRVCILFGYLCSAMMGVVVFLTILLAFLNNMKITVTINSFGEAYIELFVMPIVLGVSFLGLVFLLRSWGVKRRVSS